MLRVSNLIVKKVHSPRFWCRLLGIVLFPLAVCAIHARPLPESNDQIFPASPEAKAYIDFGTRGFLVEGKRTFIVSAGMDYARVPRALWSDRLRRIQRAGFNTIETYTFWNFHEPREGQFDFSGDHDLNAFLQLVHAMGLYAIVRVGPFSCAEWDSGGYPLWLRSKPDLLVREDNPEFLRYVDRYFQKLIPIVAANQINHGGPVIMVQLENEHPLGWGTSEPNAYFRHLRETALNLGLQVPYFFSGMHHGSDPAKQGATLDEPGRPNPWFSTELWCVFYNRYGSTEADAVLYDPRVWKIIARGGQGFNIYMAYGGSNFGYMNNNEDAASYDYGAAIGQDGDLRPLYFHLKRAAWFATSFASIIENSVNASSTYAKSPTNPAMRMSARQSSSGTVVFLDNPTNAIQRTRIELAGKLLPESGELSLAPGEIMPVVKDFTLAPGIQLDWAVARILGTLRQGNQTVILLRGGAGDPVELSITTTQKPQIQQGASAFTIDAGHAILRASIPANGVDAYRLRAGAQTVLVLAMRDELADRTWRVGTAGSESIVIGPEYVGASSLSGNQLQLAIERPWSDLDNFQSLVYTASGTAHAAPIALNPAPRALTLEINPWQWKDATAAAAPDFNDRSWLRTTNPVQMGADGDLTADAWYRTTVDVPSTANYVLHVQGGGDRARSYIDGEEAGAGSNSGGDFAMRIPAGKHTLALFTAHDGREKFGGYIGEISSLDQKGLSGPATLLKGSSIELMDWRMARVLGNSAPPAEPPSAGGKEWRAYRALDNAFGRSPGYAWLDTTVILPHAEHHVLHLCTANDEAVIYVDGEKVASHSSATPIFDVSLDGRIRENVPVRLTILLVNPPGAGGLYSSGRITSYDGDPISVPGWKMHGGVEPDSSGLWADLQASVHLQGPAFFRTSFDWHRPDSASGSEHHGVYRVTTDGLGHGSVWVNGHNLGRYPEKIPVDGLYIPECWIRQGANTLVIFDEDGSVPAHVAVRAEVTASRDIESVKFNLPQ